jgi:hypothetical protein
MNPISDPTTASGIGHLYEWGALVTLLVLIVLALLYAVRTLYERNQTLADNVTKALVDNTASNNALASQIERLNDAR